MSDLARDLVGYRPNLPDPQWPGGARLAVNFALNYEEGSEYSIANGDGRSEVTLTEIPVSPVPAGERDLAAESMFEYGSRVGFWRIMRVFAERELPMTIFGCALALERNPAAAQAIVAAGHDICCHGWRWVEHFKLGEAEERHHIRRAIESLEHTVGQRPLGWYCRYGRIWWCRTR
jgi:allantoinase